MVTASFTCTVYQLSLGSADASTGCYARQYTPVTARVAVIPRGIGVNIMGVGYYAKTDAQGITGTELGEGDIIKVTYGSVGVGLWQVMGRETLTFGNVFICYRLSLARILYLPFIPMSVGNYGFETISTDPVTMLVTEGFENGFERIIIVI
jgi:hypothetical protein